MSRYIKYFLLFLSLIAVGACEYDFELSDLDRQGRIYIYSIPRSAEVLEVITAVAYPYSAGPDYKTSEVNLTVKVNDQVISMYEDTAYVPELEGERKYRSDLVLEPGDVVSISAEAEGVAPVSSVTVVPEEVPLIQIKADIVTTDKAEVGHVSEELRDCLQFTVSLEPQQQDECYAVRVIRITRNEETGYYDESQLLPYVWMSESYLSSRKPDPWIEFDGCYMPLCEVKAGESGFNVQVSPYMTSGYETDFVLTVYRMSEEFRNHAKALWNYYEKYGMIWVAFSHSAYMYTNVEDGVGLAAAVNVGQFKMTGLNHE